MADNVNEKKDGIHYDFIAGFHFKVSFPSIQATKEETDVQFQDVSGLSAEIQLEEVWEGGNNISVYKLPKPLKYGNLVLKRALVSSKTTLLEWVRKAVEDFDFETKNVIVELIDGNGVSVKGWQFINAYPVKVSISDLGAQKNELVIETLELAYQNIKRF